MTTLACQTPLTSNSNYQTLQDNFIEQTKAEIIQFPEKNIFSNFPRQAGFAQIPECVADHILTFGNSTTLNVYRSCINNISNWEISIKNIARRAHINKDTARIHMGKLIDEGYIIRDLERNPITKRFEKGRYRFFAFSVKNKNIIAVNPRTIIPDKENPVPENPVVNNTSFNNNTTTNFLENSNFLGEISDALDIDPKQKTPKQNPVNTTNVVDHTRALAVGQTKSESTNKSCGKQDVVVEKNIKKENKNSSLVDFGTQLKALESHKTETPVKSKPICRPKEKSPRPIKRVNLKPVPKRNESPHPEKTPSKDRRSETNHRQQKEQVPENKEKILSNRNQAIKQVPLDLQKKLSDDDKLKVWNVLGEMQDKLSVDELAQRLIHSILNSKPGPDGQSRIAGHFYSSCSNLYPIPKQKTHSVVESEKEAEIRRTRIPVYTPPKPLTEQERKEATEFIEKSCLSLRLSQELAKNPIKPNPAYKLRNRYYDRINRPELRELQ